MYFRLFMWFQAPTTPFGDRDFRYCIRYAPRIMQSSLSFMLTADFRRPVPRETIECRAVSKLLADDVITICIVAVTTDREYYAY